MPTSRGAGHPCWAEWNNHPCMLIVLYSQNRIEIHSAVKNGTGIHSAGKPEKPFHETLYAENLFRKSPKSIPPTDESICQKKHTCLWYETFITHMYLLAIPNPDSEAASLGTVGMSWRVRGARARARAGGK